MLWQENVCNIPKLVIVVLWLKNYLSGRFQRITVHGATSQSLPITSGVPQGSLLSPFLFSLYINDLPNHLSSSTGVGLFADDTKLYKAVQNPSDALDFTRRYTASPMLVRVKQITF